MDKDDKKKSENQFAPMRFTLKAKRWQNSKQTACARTNARLTFFSSFVSIYSIRNVEHFATQKTRSKQFDNTNRFCEDFEIKKNNNH